MHELKVHAEYLESGDWCFGSSSVLQVQPSVIERNRRGLAPTTSAHVVVGSKHLPSPPAAAQPAPTHRRAKVMANLKTSEAVHSRTGTDGLSQTSSNDLQSRDEDRTAQRSAVVVAADSDEEGA
jgi:hypothetical protein